MVSVINQSSLSYRQEHSPLRICANKDSTIRQKNETLLFYPLYKNMERPIHLTSYNGKELGIITGLDKPYRYSTIDQYLRELTKLKIADPLGKALANCYYNAWYKDAKIEDGDVFYIDAHQKVVWSSVNIPKGMISSKKQVLPSLKQFHIHGIRGHPLYCETDPADSHLTDKMLPLIINFEESLGEEVVLVIVCDREGLSLQLFKELKAKGKYILTALRENQYNGLNDFEMLSDFVDYTDPRTNEVTHKVSEAQYLYHDLENKTYYKVRCALTIDLTNRDKLVPLISTVPRSREPNILKVASWYLGRWNAQENSFKYMIEFVNLNSNFGLKTKFRVPNRLLEKSLQKINQSIRISGDKIQSKEQRLKNISELLSNQKERYNKKEASFISRRLMLNSKKECAKDEAIGLKLTDKLEKHTFQEHSYRTKHYEKIAKYVKQIEKLHSELEDQRTNLKKNQRKLEAVNFKEELFEIDTEKDQIMTHFKIALNNCALWAREHYFPEKYKNASSETFERIFFSQDGFVKQTPTAIVVILDHYRDESLQKDAEEVCRKINKRNIRAPDGKLIRMYIAKSK